MARPNTASGSRGLGILKLGETTTKADRLALEPVCSCKLAWGYSLREAKFS